MPSLFYESFEYTDPKTNKTVEYPPLVLDDDIKGRNSIKNAVPILRGITATAISNNTMYTYMKACFENCSLRLLKSSAEKDSAYKNEEITPEEFTLYIQTDLLIQELSNIKQTISPMGNILYDRIVKTAKRDRATALSYSLSYVNELEDFNRKNNQEKSEAMDYFFCN